MRPGRIKVKITLMEEMLGMCAKPDVHAKYIASKAPDHASMKEEVEALGVDEVTSNTRTVFPKEDGIPFVWDYQIKGMFKDCCGALRRVDGTHSSKLKAYKRYIDGQIFPGPRKIMLQIPKGSSISSCQRPLRAETAQGPRIALANSETVPEGTTLEFYVSIMEPPPKRGMPSLEECVIEWLEYGQYRGLGQWRNSGKGVFSFEILEEKGR